MITCVFNFVAFLSEKWPQPDRGCLLIFILACVSPVCAKRRECPGCFRLEMKGFIQHNPRVGEVTYSITAYQIVSVIDVCFPFCCCATISVAQQQFLGSRLMFSSLEALKIVGEIIYSLTSSSFVPHEWIRKYAGAHTHTSPCICVYVK